MRLIDADALIKSLTDWRKNWEESEDSYEKTWTLTAIDFFKSLWYNRRKEYPRKVFTFLRSVCAAAQAGFFYLDTKILEKKIGQKAPIVSA